MIEAPLPTPSAPTPEDDGGAGADVPAAPPGESSPDEQLVPEQAGHPATGRSKSRRKSTHPAVPAWEDVLLGVRSQRG